MNSAPILFIGHGSPLLAISPDRHTRAWEGWGCRCSRPTAVAVVSAHWVTHGVRVSSTALPETIHDFFGFPEALYQERYPASGSLLWAEKVHRLLRPWSAQLDPDYGLDHGAWAPLKYIFPKADIPVFQISLDAQMSPQDRYALGQALGTLRAEGLMILGSGNVVHNLSLVHWGPHPQPLAWAQAFEATFRDELMSHRHTALIENAEQLPHWHLAHPNPDHYWPAQVVLGAQATSEPIEILTNGIELGSISMLSWSSALAPRAAASGT